MLRCARHTHRHPFMGLTPLIFTKTSGRGRSCQLQLKQKGGTAQGVGAQRPEGLQRAHPIHHLHITVPGPASTESVVTETASAAAAATGPARHHLSQTTALDAYLNTSPDHSSSVAQWPHLLPVF